MLDTRVLTRFVLYDVYSHPRRFSPHYPTLGWPYREDIRLITSASRSVTAQIVCAGRT
jgi:hypothetical protein